MDASTTYAVRLEFLNENDPNNIINISEEIKAEDDEHLICYEVSGGADIAITRTDSDGLYEVGLETSWETGIASTGSILLELRHQPGSKDGTCAPGDSDVEVDFEITIQ